MRNSLVISIFLFTLGFVLINGFNNAVSKIFLFSLIAIYILVPAWFKMRGFILRQISFRKNRHHKVWA